MNTGLGTIKSLCHLISQTSNFNVFLIDSKGEVLYEAAANHALNPLYDNNKLKLFKLLQFEPHNDYSFPIIRRTIFFETYILVGVMGKQDIHGTIIMGPVVTNPLSEVTIISLLNDLQAFAYQEKTINYYKSIPISDNRKLVSISLMVFYMLNGILLSPEDVHVNNNYEPQSANKDKDIQLSVSMNLQNGILHHDPLIEKKFLSIIKEGRIEDVQSISSIAGEELTVALSKSSYIRSIKNQIIILIALVTRAAIEGGLASETAFSLSDTYIQRLEELNDIEKMKQLAEEVRYTFTKKVHEVKNERFTKTITSCKNYIHRHLYEEINHGDIADHVKISPTYLSFLFKKEVGLTVRDYIQHARIEEAKKMIIFSNTPISKICSLLNFTDQSYFTKVFKKHAGLTPKQYREKQHLI